MESWAVVSYWGLYEVDSFRVDQIRQQWWPRCEMHDPPLASAVAKAPTHAQLVKWRFQKLKLQRRKHVSRGGAGWVTILICEIAGYLGKSPAREWEVHRQRMFGEIRLYCALCRVWPPRRVWRRVCERIPAWHGKFRRSRGTEQPSGRQLRYHLTLKG